jgi:type I restriction enzyme M protein
MTLTALQREHQAELHSKLWTMANDLRGNMEAYEFKNYILSIIFYRYLSERTEKFMDKLLKDDAISYEEAWQNAEYRDVLIAESLDSLGYVIEPDYLFATLIKSIEENKFDIEMLQKAVNNVVESTIGNPSQEAFDGLFEDLDLTSSKLGREVKNRTKLMSKILVTTDSIEFEHEDVTIDVLGMPMNTLSECFAANAGKKAGEFWTPVNISVLVSRLATIVFKDVLRVCDPACGSAGLLLQVSKHANVRKFFGMELTSTTWNLARMNMLLHNVPYTNFNIKNCDTLENPYFKDELFQIQVANPPYSTSWSADPKFLEDERFSIYGRLAPKSKADFAFVQHMLHHMTDDGVAVVLLPHGVLFRGGAEGAIREHIIKKQNYLDAVIGLLRAVSWGPQFLFLALYLGRTVAKIKTISAS